MIDWIGAALVHIWISYLLTGPALGALFFLFEHNEWRGWAIFMTLVAAVIAFFKFDVSLITLAEYAGGYLVTGLVWSLYRYRRHVIAEVERVNQLGIRDSSYYNEADVVRRLHPTQMLSTITAWIIVWPFSFIDNFISDIIDGIQMLVKKVFHGAYIRIYEAAIAGLNIPKKED
jgi:hypothetical protein